MHIVDIEQKRYFMVSPPNFLKLQCKSYNLVLLTTLAAAKSFCNPYLVTSFRLTISNSDDHRLNDHHLMMKFE